MLIEGEIELRFAGQTLRPAVGEQVLIPAGEPHTVTNVGASRNRWLYGYRRGGPGKAEDSPDGIRTVTARPPSVARPKERSA